MGDTLRLGRGRRKRGVGRHFLYYRRRELFGLKGGFACLPNDHGMPPEALSTVKLDSPLGNENLAVDTTLLIDLDVNVEFTLVVKTISSQQRTAGTEAPQLVAGLTASSHYAIDLSSL